MAGGRCDKESVEGAGCNFDGAHRDEGCLKSEIGGRRSEVKSCAPRARRFARFGLTRRTPREGAKEAYFLRLLVVDSDGGMGAK